MSKSWFLNNLTKIDDNDEVKGPPKIDHYDGPHELKPVIKKSISTVLQCIFRTPTIDRNFFQQLPS